MKEIVIIGGGEIGSSVKEVEERAGNIVYIRELNSCEGNLNSHYAVCHVCIPYKNEKQFIPAVCSHLKKITADVIIIHSTVAVGITRKIYNKGYRNVVHSFVRGIHPNLTEGLLTFEKPVGGICGKAIKLADDHLESIGITTMTLATPETSELGKLLSTTYYGWNILFAKLVNEMCEKLEISYDEVYTWTNETYNDGYTLLDKKNVIRPVLFSPDGKIGGHCVGPNFELLPDGDMKRIVKELNE